MTLTVTMTMTMTVTMTMTMTMSSEIPGTFFYIIYPLNIVIKICETFAC